MFRPFPPSARGSVAGVVLGDAPLPQLPGFCNKPPSTDAAAGLGRPAFSPRMLRNVTNVAAAAQAARNARGARANAGASAGRPGPGPLQRFGPGIPGRVRRTSVNGPEQQLLVSLLFLLENAFKRGNEAAVQRAKAIALHFGLLRLAAAVSDAGTRLRISDMPTVEKWPGRQESIREYVSAQQYALKKQRGEV